MLVLHVLGDYDSYCNEYTELFLKQYLSQQNERVISLIKDFLREYYKFTNNIGSITDYEN